MPVLFFALFGYFSKRAIRESPLRLRSGLRRCYGLRPVGAGVPDGPCGTRSETGGTPHPVLRATFPSRGRQ